MTTKKQLATDVEARDVRALRRQPHGRGLPDPRSRAGHDRTTVLVSLLHVQTCSRSSYLSTLPLAFTGRASTTTARRGTL